MSSTMALDFKPGEVRLTGRTRKAHTGRYAARGLRSDALAREYVCSCGHTGWSNHVWLTRLEQKAS